MTAPEEVSPARAVAELRALHELTADEHGAQRVAWTPNWQRARDWFRERLTELPVAVEIDEAGNLWATLAGRSPRSVVIGGHLDSVPNGGWLDGSLDVVAGLEVLRSVASRGVPAVSLQLVDFADEEGVRFGRSLFGSSCVSGTIDLEEVAGLRDSGGNGLPEVLAEHGVELARATDARRRLEAAAAYLELHVEQGPVLERLGLPLGVVVGTYHIERHAVRFVGRTAHESWPMEARRDALAAAARLTLEAREIARRKDGFGTVGSVVPRPGFVTAVAGSCELTLDLRHRQDAVAEAMVEEARAASAAIASEEGVAVQWSPLWQMPAVDFHPDLVRLAVESVEEVAGESRLLPSGPLHDAAEIARAGVPAVMLFVQSLDGVSHSPEEDTRPEHLELSVVALARLTDRAMDWVR
jgi:N-carbamoyl-L-amino-acid hydrolase